MVDSPFIIKTCSIDIGFVYSWYVFTHDRRQSDRSGHQGLTLRGQSVSFKTHLTKLYIFFQQTTICFPCI